MSLITLNTPSGIKKFLKDRLVTILNLKQTGKDYRSLSRNTYYINLDDAHLLLMHQTTDNDNVIDNYDIEYDETDTTYHLKFTNDGGTTYVDVPTLYPTATSLDDIYCNVVDCSPDYVDLESVQSIPGEKTFSLQKLNTAINDIGTNKFVVMDGNGQISPATMTLNDFNVAVGTPPDMSAYLAKDDIYKANDAIAIHPSAQATALNCTAIGLNASSSSDNSIAIGRDTIASGLYRCVAVGGGSEATGGYSIALGAVAQATAKNSIAMGFQAQATYEGGISIGTDSITSSGHHAIAIGDNAQAPQGGCVALGPSAISNGRYSSVAIGNQSSATNDKSIALGSQAQANGDYAIAVGSGTQATADAGIAIGRDTVTNDWGVGMGTGGCEAGHTAVALGCQAKALGRYSMAFGLYSNAAVENTIAIGHLAQATASDYAIAIGYNAQASHNRTIAIGTDAQSSSHNNVTIGTSSNTSGSFDVAIGYNTQATAHYAVAIGRDAQATSNCNVSIGYNAGQQITSANIISLHSNSDTDGNARGLFIKSDPSNFRCVVGCKQSEVETYLGQNYQMHVVGNLNYTGSLSNTSDEQLKTDIKSLSHYSLEDILKLRPVEFKWKEEEKEGEQYGLIAQEVEEVIPELVDNKSEYKSLKYTSLIPILIKCIQELKEQNDKLENKINFLENNI